MGQGFGVAGQVGAQLLAKKAGRLVIFAAHAGGQEIEIVLVAVQAALGIFGQRRMVLGACWANAGAASLTSEDKDNCGTKPPTAA